MIFSMNYIWCHERKSAVIFIRKILLKGPLTGVSPALREQRVRGETRWEDCCGQKTRSPYVITTFRIWFSHKLKIEGPLGGTHVKASDIKITAYHSGSDPHPETNRGEFEKKLLK